MEGSQTECVQLLIDAGADLNAANQARAALSSRFPVRESRPLTRQSLSRTQYDGTTPLHTAAYCGKTECVRRLVAAGANKDIAPHSGPFAGKKPINMAKNDEMKALLR